MKTLRLLVYFCLGLALGGVSVLALADTVPAVPGSVDPTISSWSVSGWNSGPWGDPLTACQTYLPVYAGQSAVASASVVKISNIRYECHWSGGVVANPINAVQPYCASNQTFNGATFKCDGALVCPDSSYTLVGQNCVKPDQPCEESQIQRDGVCVCDPSVLAAFPTQYGESMQGSGSTPSSACVGGCMRNVGDFCLGGGGSWWCSGGSWTSQKCSGGATDTPKPPNKKPPCDASEGVMTSSSGTVACVPEGTPNARQPKKAQTTSKETLPDGTVKETTKSTVCDDATGACNTTTTTKTTSSGGSVTNDEKVTDSGGDGAMGTGTGDNSGDEPGECAKEPNSPMCKKGQVKEKGSFAEGQDAELLEVKGQLTAKFNEIRAQLSAALQTSTGVGLGSLPCPPPVSVLGATISFCVADYSEALSSIGAIVVFAAAILAILLVVTA